MLCWEGHNESGRQRGGKRIKRTGTDGYGGTRPTLETLEKLAAAVGGELVVGISANLFDNRSIAKLVREGHAVIRRAN